MDVFTINYKKNKWIYIYYIILHFICLSWTNTEMVAPPTVMRLGITMAVFFPLIKYFWLSPAVIILFVSLRFNSVAPFGYIPQTWLIYELCIIIIAIVHSLLYKKKYLFKFSNIQISLLLFIFIIDLINLKIFSPLFLFLITLYILYNAIRDKVSLNITMLSPVILTITLSIYYFVFAKEFMEAYYGSDVERAVWVDPNYFGILLGCGIIISGAYIFSSIKVKIDYFYKLIFVISIILGYITIVLQASRGAILAITSSLLIQILLSKTKLIYKILILIISFLGIIYLFNSGYFTLLIDRTLNDDTGSGRFEIWASKFNAWLDNPINLIGCGYQSVVYDFSPKGLDCHNEFISILINYGIIGAVIVILAIFRLILLENNRAFIWSTVCFIGVGFMTLSPFTCQTGWTAIPLLMVLLYKFIELDKNNQLSIS